jgi:hypothetical protein
MAATLLPALFAACHSVGGTKSARNTLLASIA